MARKDRLALHPEAQRYQSLIDRVFYRMAGPTDDKPPARRSGLRKRCNRKHYSLPR